MIFQRLGTILNLLENVIDLCGKRKELLAELKEKNEKSRRT
jgi:hypothetical protein